MSIKINSEKCVSCKKCLNVCPGSLLKLGDDSIPYIAYPKNCWGCGSCIKECKFEAISLYLGADMGGRGSTSTLTAKYTEDKVEWTFHGEQREEKIIVKRKESNTY